MSEIYSVQLTAVATLALAVLALATAVLASLALRKQSKEVSTLLRQNERDIQERRRAQASKVFLGVPPRKRLHVRPYARLLEEPDSTRDAGHKRWWTRLRGRDRRQ